MQSLAGFDSELPVYSRLPIRIVKGLGARIWDDSDREYVDFYGGHAVVSLGYGHSGLNRVLKDQLDKLIFQTNAVEVPLRDEALMKLVRVSPKGLTKAFLINSGAEANDNALRLALKSTGRKRITRLTGSFHGRTAASGAITEGHESWYGFPEKPFGVDVLETEDFSAIESSITCDTAALIFEPIQGVAGAIDLSVEFVQAAIARCKEVGALVIADEVQTGIGRTGSMFAIEQYGVSVEILTCAKGLGSGVPVAAVVCSDEVAKCVSKGQLGTTFGGGPLACSAMNVVLDVISQQDFLESVQNKSQWLLASCQVPGVKKVTGRGLMIGLHLDQPAQNVRLKLLEQGVLTGDAKNPFVIRLLPPLTVGMQDIEYFGTALKKVLS